MIEKADAFSDLKQNKIKIEVEVKPTRIVIVKKEEKVEIPEIVDIEVLKYNDYAGLIDVNLLKDFETYFKFQRASSNLGIPFESFDEIVKKDGTGNYDRIKNKKMYEEPHNEAKGKVGWRFIYNRAKDSNPREKNKLDIKYEKRIR